MSILIKGMEMPTSCDVCFMRDACEYSMPVGKRLTECPLVEVDDNEIDEAFKALKGVRDASRIITEVCCRLPEVETNE